MQSAGGLTGKNACPKCSAFLSLTKSLCTTQLEKIKASAPALLPLLPVGVLLFAMGMTKVVVDGGGTELLKSQPEKNPTQTVCK